MKKIIIHIYLIMNIFIIKCAAPAVQADTLEQKFYDDIKTLYHDHIENLSPETQEKLLFYWRLKAEEYQLVHEFQNLFVLGERFCDTLFEAKKVQLLAHRNIIKTWLAKLKHDNMSKWGRAFRYIHQQVSVILGSILAETTSFNNLYSRLVTAIEDLQNKRTITISKIHTQKLPDNILKLATIRLYQKYYVLLSREQTDTIIAYYRLHERLVKTKNHLLGWPYALINWLFHAQMENDIAQIADYLYQHNKTVGVFQGASQTAVLETNKLIEYYNQYDSQVCLKITEYLSQLQEWAITQEELESKQEFLNNCFSRIPNLNALVTEYVDGNFPQQTMMPKGQLRDYNKIFENNTCENEQLAKENKLQGALAATFTDIPLINHIIIGYVGDSIQAERPDIVCKPYHEVEELMSIKVREHPFYFQSLFIRKLQFMQWLCNVPGTPFLGERRQWRVKGHLVPSYILDIEKRYVWPSTLDSYIAVCNYRPSQEFYDYVMNFSLIEIINKLIEQPNQDNSPEEQSRIS